MNINTVKAIFWTTFILAIVVLFLNIGLGLIAFGLILLPLLVAHFSIGLRINKLQDQKPAIIFSAINLLVFTLIRPDGAHTLNENGLSSLLDIFGVNAGYSREYEDFFAYSTLVLFLVQVIMDFRLYRIARRNS